MPDISPAGVLGFLGRGWGLVNRLRTNKPFLRVESFEVFSAWLSGTTDLRISIICEVNIANEGQVETTLTTSYIDFKYGKKGNQTIRCYEAVWQTSNWYVKPRFLKGSIIAPGRTLEQKMSVTFENKTVKGHSIPVGQPLKARLYICHLRAMRPMRHDFIVTLERPPQA
jgi:hypothetical protein